MPWITPAADSNPSLEGQTNDVNEENVARGHGPHTAATRQIRTHPSQPGQGAQPPTPGMKRNPSHSKGAHEKREAAAPAAATQAKWNIAELPGQLSA
jgi:hypothetical protein